VAPYDVALIRLDAPSSVPVMPVMTPDVEPLFDQSINAGLIAGWGRIDANPRSNVYPVAIEQAVVPIWSNTACGAYAWGLPTLVLCAGAAGVSACSGDSGGPLLALDVNRRLVVAGVVSGGPTVCGSGIGIYTRLSGFAAWITAVTGLPRPGTPAVAAAPSGGTAPAQAGSDVPRDGRGGSVYRLYRAYFLRAPDAGGMAYWLGRYDGGMPLSAISAWFAQSPEFVARYGSLDSGSFVKLVYRNVLNREPDPGGYAHWAPLVESRRLSRGAMMIGFSESPEFRALTGTV
jgi:hypothetical protein